MAPPPSARDVEALTVLRAPRSASHRPSKAQSTPRQVSSIQTAPQSDAIRPGPTCARVGVGPGGFNTRPNHHRKRASGVGVGVGHAPLADTQRTERCSQSHDPIIAATHTYQNPISADAPVSAKWLVSRWLLPSASQAPSTPNHLRQSQWQSSPVRPSDEVGSWTSTWQAPGPSQAMPPAPLADRQRHHQPCPGPTMTVMVQQRTHPPPRGEECLSAEPPYPVTAAPRRRPHAPRQSSPPPRRWQAEPEDSQRTDHHAHR